jgi:hypothetical protein
MRSRKQAPKKFRSLFAGGGGKRSKKKKKSLPKFTTSPSHAHSPFPWPGPIDDDEFFLRIVWWVLVGVVLL